MLFTKGRSGIGQFGFPAWRWDGANRRVPWLALTAEVRPLFAFTPIRKDAHASYSTRCILPEFELAAVLLTMHRSRVGHVRLRRWAGWRRTARHRQLQAN